jgi:hypothetical protein
MRYAYHVLPQGQSLRTVLSPTGRGFISVREISGVIDDGPARGTRFDVQVYADGATPESVALAIEAEVDHLSRVALLGSTGLVE